MLHLHGPYGTKRTGAEPPRKPLDSARVQQLQVCVRTLGRRSLADPQHRTAARQPRIRTSRSFRSSARPEAMSKALSGLEYLRHNGHSASCVKVPSRRVEQTAALKGTAPCARHAQFSRTRTRELTTRPQTQSRNWSGNPRTTDGSAQSASPATGSVERNA